MSVFSHICKCERLRRDPGYAIIAGLGLVFFALMFKSWIHGDDGVRYYSYLRSFVMDGDIDFTNEFNHYEDEAIDVMRRDPVTRRIVNAVPCGSSVMWGPWFLAAHACVKAARLVGASVAAEGYSKPYVIAVCLGSAFYAMAGLLLLYWTLRRWFRKTQALGAVIAVWLAGPLVFYMFAHPSMSHANSFFCTSALLAACARWGPTRSAGGWALIGALAGLAMLVRYNSVLWALAPAAMWFVLIKDACVSGHGGKMSGEGAAGGSGARNIPCLLALGVICAACAVLAFSPQLLAWKYMHGSFFSGPRDFQLDSHLSVWSSPHLVDALLSARRGVFFWMPVAVLALLGWITPTPRAAKPTPACEAASASAVSSIAEGETELAPASLKLMAPVIFFLNAWMVGAWEMWWGGASFGPRFFIDCFPLLALGIAAAFNYPRAWRKRTTALIVGALVVWNFGLMAQYALRMINREGELSRREVIMNQLRVPGEIWRRADDIIHKKDKV